MSRLKLVGLPIGNLKDITQRAIEELNKAHFIFCEDTKNFRKIAGLLNINLEHKTLDSFHDHSQDQKIRRVIQLLNQKNDVVFVSDAGSPIISDPAYPLVEAITRETDHQLDSIPGVSALTTALEVSGLPADPLHFYGFLPRDKNGVMASFENSKLQLGTHVFFESPNRIVKTIDLLVEVMDFDFPISICRELTKLYEEVYRFNASEWNEIKETIRAQGECVLLFYISRDKVNEGLNLKGIGPLIDKVMQRPGHPKDLSKLISKLTGRKADELYKEIIQKER